jgi:hypothetical protein
MSKWLLSIMLLLFTINTHASSMRCKGALVTAGDSSNALLKKCGQPVRKYNSRTQVKEKGKRSQVAVSNWVYERRGRKDMIASVRNGTVIRIQVD